jgi:hypothetical protein
MREQGVFMQDAPHALNKTVHSNPLIDLGKRRQLARLACAP